jgi:hypothetical protein
MTLDEFLAMLRDSKQQLALAAEPPLAEIAIGDKVFAVGQLSLEELQAEHQRELRIMHGTATQAERDPFFKMKLLLKTGNPSFSWDDLPPTIPINMVVTFATECYRQILVAKLANIAGVGYH